MNKVIVTGANGFIGSNLLKVLSEKGVKIFAIIKDRNETITHIENLPGVQIVYCEMDDVGKLPTLINDRDIDTCIHLAWAGSFGDSRSDYEQQLQNVKFALNTVDVIAKMGVKRFVGAGTLAEKDVMNYHPTDGATPNAVSIYGIAKICMHFMTKAECTKVGIEHVWCYLSNTYGVGNTTNNFVNMACRKMLRGERASFTSGEQMYDFVYITDTVRALYYVSEKGKKNCSYYLGSTKPRKLKEYIKIIKDNIDPNIDLFLGEIPYNGIPLKDSDYDSSKLVKDTGFKPQIPFEEGIKKTIQWLRKDNNDSNIISNDVINSVIISGANGFVGSYTVQKFLDEGKRVLALDIVSDPDRLKPHPLLKYLQCDVADTELMSKQIQYGKYDAFIHFAWLGSAGSSRTDYNLQMQNALNTVECMKMAHSIGCKRFVCAGSIMEYEVELAIHAQGSKPGMGYIYGMGKQIAHNMCKAIAAKVGIDLIWPMITNAYGVGELSPRFVNTTLRKIIDGEPLQFTAATQNYDFVYVTDVAEAFYLITTKGKPFHEYMIGSGNAKPLKDFILEMLSACGPGIKPVFGDIPFSGTNVPLSVYSIDSIKNDCGFCPKISFVEGTKMTMEWLKSQA